MVLESLLGTLIAFGSISSAKESSMDSRLSQKLSTLNYQEVIPYSFEPRDSIGLVPSVDMAFENGRKQLLVRFHVRPKDPKLMGRLISLQEKAIGTDWIISTRDDRGNFISILLVGVDEAEAQKMNEKLRAKKIAGIDLKNIFFGILLAETAIADEVANCREQNRELQHVIGVKESFDNYNEAEKLFAACASSAANHIQAAVKSDFAVFEGIDLQYSEEGLRKSWQDLGESWGALVKMRSEVVPLVYSLLQASRNLSPEIKTTFICSSLAGLGYKGIKPGGIVKRLAELPKLAEFLKTISSLDKLEEYLSKTNFDSVLGRYVKRVSKCAI